MKSSGKQSPAAETSTAGAYQARPSHSTVQNIASDGLVWKERLAVVEGVTENGNPQLRLRSYFRDPVTGERVWDEAPSGASSIVFATQDMRRVAETQRKEMQSTLDLIPTDASGEEHPRPPGKKKGLLARFSLKKKERVLKDDSKDINLQRAIARSMVEDHNNNSSSSSRGNGTQNSPHVLYDPGTDASGFQRRQQDEDEDLALAKALSLSSVEEQQQPDPSSSSSNSHSSHSQQRDVANMTEEEMIALAITESRLDEQRVPKPKRRSKAKSKRAESCRQPKEPPVGTFDPYAPRHDDIDVSSDSYNDVPDVSESSSSTADHLPR